MCGGGVPTSCEPWISDFTLVFTPFCLVFVLVRWVGLAPSPVNLIPINDVQIERLFVQKDYLRLAFIELVVYHATSHSTPSLIATSDKYTLD